MQKTLLLLTLFLSAIALNAQDVMLLYDFGRAGHHSYEDGPHTTTTVENFSADKWGSSYYFVDMYYKSNGVNGAYWEISRELKFWDAPISAHIEYNGGLNLGFPFNHAYLAGATYSLNSDDFKRGISFTAMYKYIYKQEEPHNFQLTAVWHWNFADGLCDFSGFIDFWKEKQPGIDADFVFLSQPELWLNLNHISGVPKEFNLSVGTEVEFNYNFAYVKGFHCLPALGVKWTF
ncbi:MAG: DUF5020 family protein [Ignavibacteria bacterium]|jgi:hypothetical protein|nr:DUF5020 family protein [Ignavibacteria bacterium]